jgi:hypothetical protein
MSDLPPRDQATLGGCESNDYQRESERARQKMEAERAEAQRAEGQLDIVTAAATRRLDQFDGGDQ